MNEGPSAKPAPYEELASLLRTAATLTSIRATLSWDQETMMPPRGGRFRAEEIALLSTLEHERLTDPRIAELLDACESDRGLCADETIAANLREIRRDFERATRLPGALVAEIARTSSEALEVWKEARKSSDFALFRPWLEKQFRLAMEKARCYGIPEGGEPYDPLLDEYEPGASAREIEGIFGPLRAALAPFLAEILAARHAIDPSPGSLKLPLARQREFSRFVAERIGFDFEAGRLDESTHPFTEGLAPGDTRITSRFAEDHATDALGSTLHEAGHALYEQGLAKDRHHGLPQSQAIGLAIHESQSRMWENHVGRSRAFWVWALPEAKRLFGPPLEPYSVDQLYAYVNQVRPSLIRVEADETTYNLHVMLRFDVERALIRGDLAVADLPALWNERMRADLGQQVPDDRRGCLQDIHWAAGAIGYFPTYTLGTLYAAQLWETIREAIPDLEKRVARGEFSALLAWLRENVHAQGRRWRAGELCQRLTGKPLGHGPMLRHLEAKLRPIHGI